MAKKTNKVANKFDKKGFMNSFTLIGKAKIGNYTFKIDEKAKDSDWLYSKLKLGVDCGEKCGTVYAELMGGYGTERDNVIFVIGKKPDGTDDYENKYEISFEDRFNEKILADIGESKFIKVGIEVDAKGNTYTKKFLSVYDVINYVQENLKEGMVINVKGKLTYSYYNGKLEVKKNITSIFLSKVEDPKDYTAIFTQTILLTKDSVGEVDVDKSIVNINAKVVDYVKEWNKKEVKVNIPLNKSFEYEIDMTKKELTQKKIARLFKVDDDVTMATFRGIFVEGGATVQATEDDLTDDLKEMVELEIYSLDEALAICSESTGKERRMILTAPVSKKVEIEGVEKPVLQIFENKFKEEDLMYDFMFEEAEVKTDAEDDLVDAVDASDVESDDEWLKNL